MKTLQELAESYAQREDLHTEDGEYTKTTIVDAYIAGAAEKHLLLTHWNNIEEDKDGFTTNKAYAEIAASVPILVKDIVFGEMFVIDKNNMADWSGALQHHPTQYKWRKIHE